MTCPYRESIRCPSCGHVHTTETAFERWMRSHPRLDSLEGIVRFDCDVLLHRYQTVTDGFGSRDVQGLMFVEVKTYGAPLRRAQQDSLSVVSQVLRNRRPNRHAPRAGRHADEHRPPAKVYSHVLGTDVRLRLFGGHLLTLAGADPVTSDWMTWDRHPIIEAQLVDLLRLDRDPDTLRPMDWRRRSHAQLDLLFGEPR